jgi:hypothetical protein
MRMRNVTPARLLSVPCPICEVTAGNPCVFSSGVPRSEPHLDRKMLAAEDVEEKRVQRTKVKSVSSRILELFDKAGADRLPLHILFSIAGDGNKEKLNVIDAIDDLVRSGVLERSSDESYALKEEAKVLIAQLE